MQLAAGPPFPHRADFISNNELWGPIMTNPIPDRPGTRKKEKREERNVIYGIFNNSDLNANAAACIKCAAQCTLKIVRTAWAVE